MNKFWTLDDATADQARYGGTIRHVAAVDAVDERWDTALAPTGATIRAEAHRRLDAGDPFARAIVPVFDAIVCQYHGTPAWDCVSCAISDMEGGEFAAWGIGVDFGIPRPKILLWLKATLGNAERREVPRLAVQGRDAEPEYWYLDGARYPQPRDGGGGYGMHTDD